MTTQDVAPFEPSGPPSPVYPVRMEVAYPHELFKWLLIIPHRGSAYACFMTERHPPWVWG